MSLAIRSVALASLALLVGGGGAAVALSVSACKITTNAGRTDERTITLVVTDR